MRYAKLFLTLTSLALTVAVKAQTSQSSVQTNAQSSNQAAVQSGNTSTQASSHASASSSASANSRQANAGLASGSTFNAALTSPVDSKKCKPGDPVRARTTENAKADGKTVLPKGTKLVGHVTRASARANGDSESALGITFDHAILKDGEEVPLNVAVQAIASAQTMASSEGNLDTMGAAGAGAADSGMAGGRGAGGGLLSSAGATVGGVTSTAASVGGVAGAVDSTLNSTTSVAGASEGAVGGLNAAGQLTSGSRGVFGLSGLNLTSASAADAQSSVITSAGRNVHLDSGTRMLMVTQTAASATPAQ